LISSTDRRVLDELDPDSTQSARDQQPIPNRPVGTVGAQASGLQVFPLLSRPQRPVIPIESIHGETRKHLANPQPARLAFQLEVRLTQSTIFSNVSRRMNQPIRCAEFEARKPFNFSVRFAGSGQTFQETSSTQWQKN
jgi:hypothetical protein